MRKFLGYKGRSVWKGIYLTSKIYNDDDIMNRRIVIFKTDIGKEVYIHNGKWFYSLKITNRHVGFRLGQFILTKRLGRYIHMSNINKKTKKNR